MRVSKRERRTERVRARDTEGGFRGKGRGGLGVRGRGG